MGLEFGCSGYAGLYVVLNDDLHDRIHGLGQRYDQLEAIADHQTSGERHCR